MSSPETLSHFVITSQFLDQILAQALDERPRECCGVVGGDREKGGLARTSVVARSIYPLRNEATGETEFSAARDLFAVQRTMRVRGEKLVAIYHSHPAAPAVPSQKDLERNYYPDAVHLIVSLVGITDSASDRRQAFRAYQYHANQFAEVKIEIPTD